MDSSDYGRSRRSCDARPQKMWLRARSDNVPQSNAICNATAERLFLHLIKYVQASVALPVKAPFNIDIPE